MLIEKRFFDIAKREDEEIEMLERILAERRERLNKKKKDFENKKLEIISIIKLNRI